jgi:hypothetical protein
MDPVPRIRASKQSIRFRILLFSVLDLQDANKNLFFLLITF